MTRRQTKALRNALRPWAEAAALGAVVGARSLLVPALVLRATRRRRAARVLPWLAAMEIAADKTRWIPARTAPASLAVRALVGAAVAFRRASSMRRRPGRSRRVLAIASAVVAASSAAASAFVLRALRGRAAIRSRATSFLAGVCEDLVALGAGRALTRV